MLHPVFGFYCGMAGSKQATADDYATLPTVDLLQAQLHVGKLFVSQDVVESERITVRRLCAVWDRSSRRRSGRPSPPPCSIFSVSAG